MADGVNHAGLGQGVAKGVDVRVGQGLGLPLVIALREHLHGAKTDAVGGVDGQVVAARHRHV